MEAKKTSSKQVVAILLLVIGLIAGVFGILGLVGGSSMTPYEARQGVVMVRGIIYDTEGNSQWGWGTGWAIGKPGEPVEYIVTNGHVVADAYEYPQQYPNEIFGSVEVYYSAAENDFAQAEIVYYSPQTQKDIAILRLPSPTEKRIALSLRESDSVKPGDTAYALGYPGNAVANQPLPKYDMNDVTMTKGIISNRTTMTSTTYEAFQMDVSIAGGNSGGPLVDESGNVMGINVATAYDLTTGQLSDVHYAIVIDELTKILDSERIAYTMAGGRALLDPALVCLCVPAHRRAGAHRRHHPAGNVPEERSGRPSSCRRCRRYGIWKSACKRRPRPCGKTGCAARRDRKILWPEL